MHGTHVRGGILHFTCPASLAYSSHAIGRGAAAAQDRMARLALENCTRLSADIGGTFTDIVLERGSARWSRKLLTTHAAPEEGLLRGVSEILSEAGIHASEVTSFAHGTTLATNALIEKRGARTALLTTAGFRDVVEIGYEGRYDPMDLRFAKQPPLVPRELRF